MDTGNTLYQTAWAFSQEANVDNCTSCSRQEGSLPYVITQQNTISQATTYGFCQNQCSFHFACLKETDLRMLFFDE